MNLKAPKHVPKPEHLNALQGERLSELMGNTTDRLAQLQGPEFLFCTDVLLTAARIRGECHQIFPKSALILKSHLPCLCHCYSVNSHILHCCDNG